MLVRNWRMAVGGPLWEFPAGKLEPGEPPERAAARELREETGCRATQLTSLGTFYTSPGFADECMHVFEAMASPEGAPTPEPGEEVEPEPFTEAEIDSMIQEGVLIDGKTLAAMTLWRARRHQERRR